MVNGKIPTEHLRTYNRQVARCLGDIEQIFELPDIVKARIKKAVEYTIGDVCDTIKGVRK